MATGKAGVDAHGWDFQCQHRRRAQELRHDQDEDFQQVDPQRLVNEQDRPRDFCCDNLRSDVIRPSS